jgi:hypothetical protein
MRLTVLIVLSFGLFGCNTSQNVYVSNEHSHTGNTDTAKSEVRMRQSSSALMDSTKLTHTFKQSTSKKPVKVDVEKVILPLPKNFDKADVDAVFKHCTNVAYETLFIKENCKTESERKICESAQFGSQTFNKEFSHCLAKYGWETY